MTARLRLALLPLLLGGCAAPEGTPGGWAPPAEPAPRAVLRELSSRPFGGDLAAAGVSGANKPNGIEYRLRRSVPAETPDFVPRRLDGLELWIADPAPGGEWLAFYRSPLGLLAGAANGRFRAVLLGPAGERRWDLDLAPFLSRPDHLEVQDVRLADGKLYFNEACQSYSREADGACSSLVWLDPVAGRVDWRTRPRVSNDVFILHGPWVVAGYGFTAEPDSLFLVDRESGGIVARHPLDSAHAYLEVVGDRLVVVTRARVYEFGTRGADRAGRGRGPGPEEGVPRGRTRAGKGVMAYGIVQFVEGGERKVTLVRPTAGHPTGADGLMDPLAAFIEASSPAILREGSPGAKTMAMAFFDRELKAGRELRILGAEGEWGISPAEVEGLEGRGYYYDVDFGRPGERSVPRILASGIERPDRG